MLLVVALVAAVIVIRTRRVVATPTERAVHATLHTAAVAAHALRKGLDPESARTAAPHLRDLTGAEGIAVYDDAGEHLANDPPDDPMWTTALATRCLRAAQLSIAGQRRVLAGGQLPALVAQPLLADDSGVIGVLVVVANRSPGPGMLGAIGEVARYASSQLELDASRARLDRAEVLALRAQIRPHFVYNALNTIASFVRTEPDRARELILEFADFTRYSFRAAGPYTLLSDELRNIDRYLTLERARFGAALEVKLQVAPEVLGVVVPFLALQPLVENAVRHGLADKHGGAVTIIARDEGADCVISVEDDGVGMDPETLRTAHADALGADPSSDSARGDQTARVGLTNVDHRLRAAFGNDYGLVVHTAVGAGTKVIMRVPKFRSGVRA